MASSVNAILDGFNYQAFWFWFYACDMLSHEAEVEGVGFEVEEYEAFDDVAVRYTKLVSDGAGNLISGKFYSIKLSVSYGKAITAGALADPGLINASSISLLQQLQAAVAKMIAAKQTHLFVIAAPWDLASGDPIQELVRTKDGSLRLDKLFDGTGPRGVMGGLRDKWRKHLKLASEDELRPILSRLRFDLRPQSQELHVEELSLRLNSVGLTRIQKVDLASKHFRLPFAWRQEGTKWFTRAEVLRVCELQLLLLPKVSAPAREARQIGIRSFLPLAEGLGEKVDDMLCMVEEFSGRAPKHDMVWSESVPKQMSEFLSNVIRADGNYDLHLHCFGSMAFLAGYLLDPKLSVSACVVQRLYGRPAELWSVDLVAVGAVEDSWVTSIETIGAGDEVAMAISVTQPVLASVIEYCRANHPSIGKVLHATLPRGASFTSIQSGTHAFGLATSLKNRMLAGGVAGKRLHLFWAAPNAFAFYLGQVSRPLGACRVYEFDMETRAYTPAVDAAPSYRLTLNQTR